MAVRLNALDPSLRRQRKSMGPGFLRGDFVAENTGFGGFLETRNAINLPN